MYKILTANFARLRRDLLFWSCLSASAILALFNILSACRKQANGITVLFDECYFSSFPFLCMVHAVCVSFFLGTEYSDGALRNKLIVGHTRGCIYAAHLFTCTAFGLLFTVAAILAGLAGLPVLGPFQMPPAELAVYLALTLLSAAALAAVYTLLGMLCSNKAGTVALLLLISLGLLVLGSYFYNMLCEPETMSEAIFITDGTIQFSDPKPNPYYVGGLQRTVYELALNALPTGQVILMANCEITHPVLNGVASLAIYVFISLLGSAMFRKKDLK